MRIATKIATFNTQSRNDSEARATFRSFIGFTLLARELQIPTDLAARSCIGEDGSNISLASAQQKKWKTMEHVQLAFTSVYNLVDSVGLFLFKQTFEVLKSIIPVKQLQGSPVDQERVCSTGLSGFRVKHDNSGHVFLRHARTDMLLNAFIYVYMSMFSFFQDF